MASNFKKARQIAVDNSLKANKEYIQCHDEKVIYRKAGRRQCLN
jgi:hypothetical protein